MLSWYNGFMKVAITGANGRVGSAIAAGLDPAVFEVVQIDLPEHDASNLDDLVAATKGADALMHFAWKDLTQNTWDKTIDPANNLMAFNAYQAALINGIPRVIMGSSNRAHRYDIRDTDGRIRPTTVPDLPNDPYGAEKHFMEKLGTYFAWAHDIGIICLRIGNLNNEDIPKPSSATDPQRWLSKRDAGRLATACLLAPEVPDNFVVMYGVSDGPVFDWVNPFGYVPLDKAE